MKKLKSQLTPYFPGGCFIATAVYPSNCYKLQTFRSFRDKILIKNKLGKKLVFIYYKESPRISDYIKKRKLVKFFVRYLIIEPIYKLIKFLFK